MISLDVVIDFVDVDDLLSEVIDFWKVFFEVEVGFWKVFLLLDVSVVLLF